MNECKGFPMSDWEWDGIVNDPKRQAEADERAADQAKRMEGRKEIFDDFHQKAAARRKERTMITACRNLTGMIATGLAAYFASTGGVAWLARVFGSAAVVSGMIAAYGFGKVRGMVCR